MGQDEPVLQGEEHASLLPPPNVPPPIRRKHPTKVIVQLETREVVKRLADGVEYVFWTYGGTVPGPLLRVREGDLVELHLNNHPDNKMPHSIDLHAATGPGGGASASFTAPGHTSQFTFKALNPGLYVYHCAAAPVGMHVANGMYGMILVEPKGGLPKVDREYYVVQGEFYTQGSYGDEGLQPFSMEKALAEKPDYVVFNGAVGALVGDNALQAKVGQTVRLFVGNGGPNLVSSFHVIGEIFDHVYPEGGTKLAQENVQTTLVPAGGSAVVDFRVEGPGTFILVDHSLLRAFNKGALGMLKVEGPENKEIYSGKQADRSYLPAGSIAPTERSTEFQATSLAFSKAERIVHGKELYARYCSACHQAHGQGRGRSVPPLAGADYLLADRDRAIRIIREGLSDAIIVNGREFRQLMPGLGLNDGEIADVLTYIYSAWGNSGEMVTPDQVKTVYLTKKLTASR
jgi:nitrite reductase (NO-forming)